MIIAIDGYSSCGKSTVAKAIAKRLRLSYIDSGAMYRAVTFYFLKHGVPFKQASDQASFDYDYKPVLNNIHIEFRINDASGIAEVYLNGVNVERNPQYGSIG